ncbi:hypothetical protein BOO71_0006421 [Deinococcus marmoris]|uniref:Uncharacterized protein n=1 Tax=Deinococcus marmoris TaxID=249408 RepID=A0A1U7NZ98_9DEIO|nr:hypothetical protein BOO71_0006421 [Deinococcus marmoris]
MRKLMNSKRTWTDRIYRLCGDRNADEYMDAVLSDMTRR